MRIACGKESERPLSRFPLRGKAGGTPPPLRYGSGKAPAQSRTLSAFWAGMEVRFNLDGASPRTPLIYFVWQTGQITC
jgi:hypothetical protein